MIDDKLNAWRMGLLGTHTAPSNGKDKSKLRFIFFTISPPSKYKVDAYIFSGGKRKKASIPYEKLSLQNQRIFLNRYFQAVYKPLLPNYFYVYEKNENNNLHIHGLTLDKDVQDDYSMLCLRDSINKHPKSLSMVNNVKLFKRLNCVVYVDDINETCEYLSKDMAQSVPHFGFMTDLHDDETIGTPEVYFN